MFFRKVGSERRRGVECTHMRMQIVEYGKLGGVCAIHGCMDECGGTQDRVCVSSQAMISLENTLSNITLS